MTPVVSHIMAIQNCHLAYNQGSGRDSFLGEWNCQPEGEFWVFPSNNYADTGIEFQVGILAY